MGTYALQAVADANISLNERLKRYSKLSCGLEKIASKLSCGY